MRQVSADSKALRQTHKIKTIRWHTTEITVQVADTDYGGGVYHGRYFALYHQARDDFMEALGIPCTGLKQQGIDLTVAELHTFFLGQVVYGDRLEVNTRILWYREKSLGMAQQMLRTNPAAGPTLRNRVEMNLVCTCRGKAVPLPGELIRAANSFYSL